MMKAKALVLLVTGVPLLGYGILKLVELVNLNSVLNGPLGALGKIGLELSGVSLGNLVVEALLITAVGAILCWLGYNKLGD